MIKLTLDKALEKHGISRYRLSKLTGIQFQVVDKYYKNKVVRYDSFVLDKMCSVLDCKIDEIIVYQKGCP